MLLPIPKEPALFEYVPVEEEACGGAAVDFELTPGMKIQGAGRCCKNCRLINGETPHARGEGYTSFGGFTAAELRPLNDEARKMLQSVEGDPIAEGLEQIAYDREKARADKAERDLADARRAWSALRKSDDSYVVSMSLKQMVERKQLVAALDAAFAPHADAGKAGVLDKYVRTPEEQRAFDKECATVRVEIDAANIDTVKAEITRLRSDLDNARREVERLRGVLRLIADREYDA